MLKSFFHRIPVPVSGVMLALVAFGNFIHPFFAPVWRICFAFALLLFVLLILKAIIVPADIRDALSDPVTSGIICTFSMGTLFLSINLVPVSLAAARALWCAATALHLFFMGNYTARVPRHFSWQKLTTTSFLAYVGIAAAAATSKAVGFERAGLVLLIFAAAAMAVLFAANIYRYRTVASPDAQKPLICIFAAPVSLCLVAYLNIAAQKNLPLVLAAAIIAAGIFVFALIKAVTYVRTGRFYPSFSAFTFPFTNTAIATFQVSVLLAGRGVLFSVFRALALLEMGVALILLVIVIAGYINAIVVAPAIAHKTAPQPR